MLFLSIAQVAQAQPASVEFRLETQTLEVGETVDGTLTLTNTGKAEKPLLPVLDGLSVLLVNPTPNTVQSMQIVNGQSSQTIKQTYSIRVAAQKEGRYRIPPIHVVAGGTRYQTASVDIVVRKSEAGAAAKGDRLIYAEIEVDRRRLYITQSYRAVLTIGIRKVEIGGRVYEIERLLNAVIDGRSTDLSVFQHGQYSTSELSLSDSAGRSHRYEVFRVPVELRAEQVGEFEVGPVFLAARYPTSLRRGFFGSVEVGDTKRETARAEAVVITILAPPDAGRPADYTGAVGRYTLSVAVKPDRVQQGQPVTLTLSIRGAPIEGIAGPNLQANAELVSRFDFTKDELTGDLEQGAKVFRRAIFPKQQGEQTVPMLSWSYFDPQDERYVSLNSQPIRITVDPGLEAASKYVGIGQELKGLGGVTTLTALQGGLSPLYVDPQIVLASQDTLFGVPTLAALGGAPVMWLAITWVTGHRRKLQSDVKWARRRRARRVAELHLQRAAREVAKPAQAAECADGMVAFLAERFDLPRGPITPWEANEHLLTHGVAVETADRIATFLEGCDAIRFAPNEGDSFDVSAAAALVREWIHIIERTAK